ncbi:hypothetical protein ACOID8_30325, partial [Klebsiella pneumoniae]|uniref:hypothetical protein n=1 Tax=Klebsiella pneumoniae TaxID=573 RepID=UPI003B5CCE90
ASESALTIVSAAGKKIKLFVIRLRLFGGEWYNWVYSETGCKRPPAHRSRLTDMVCEATFHLEK